MLKEVSAGCFLLMIMPMTIACDTEDIEDHAFNEVANRNQDWDSENSDSSTPDALVGSNDSEFSEQGAEGSPDRFEPHNQLGTDHPGQEPAGPDRPESNAPDPQATCSSVCSAFHPVAPVTCTWETATNSASSDEATASCDSGSYPIAGGCRTTDATANLQVSMAFEGTAGNPMDDGDLFWTGTGWTCDYDTSPAAGTHLAMAMCCAAVGVTECSC